MSIPHGYRHDLQIPAVRSRHRWVYRKGTPCETARVSPARSQWNQENSHGSVGTPLPIDKAEMGQILLMTTPMEMEMSVMKHKNVQSMYF